MRLPRLPRSPYVYFGLDGGSGVVLSRGKRQGRKEILDMIAKVGQCAQLTFWPDGSVVGAPDRLTSNVPCCRPRAGRYMMIWDGENYTLWTGISQADLKTVCRFATSFNIGQK